MRWRNKNRTKIDKMLVSAVKCGKGFRKMSTPVKTTQIEFLSEPYLWNRVFIFAVFNWVKVIMVPLVIEVFFLN
jgi:hypothetical protein